MEPHRPPKNTSRSRSVRERSRNNRPVQPPQAPHFNQPFPAGHLNGNAIHNQPARVPPFNG